MSMNIHQTIKITIYFKNIFLQFISIKSKQLNTSKNKLLNYKYKLVIFCLSYNFISNSNKHY